MLLLLLLLLWNDYLGARGMKGENTFFVKTITFFNTL